MKRLLEWWRAPIPEIMVFRSRSQTIPVAEADAEDLRRSAKWNRRQAEKVTPTRRARMLKRARNETIAEWLEGWAEDLNGGRVCDLPRRQRRRFAKQSQRVQQLGSLR